MLLLLIVRYWTMLVIAFSLHRIYFLAGSCWLQDYLLARQTSLHWIVYKSVDLSQATQSEAAPMDDGASRSMQLIAHTSSWPTSWLQWDQNQNLQKFLEASYFVTLSGVGCDTLFGHSPPACSYRLFYRLWKKCQLLLIFFRKREDVP